MLSNYSKFKRAIPYIIFAVVTAALAFWFNLSNGTVRDILQNLLSDSIFFFVAFFFFDLTRSVLRSNESKYIDTYIRNNVSNDIFVALYYQKKIIHGYNLETNTLSNIMGILNCSKETILNAVTNQRYIGFQIFKDTNEVRSLFDEVINSNVILKYSTHLETINLLKISNNLSLMEAILKNEDSFNRSHPSSSEFVAVDSKKFNPNNPEGYLLLRKAPRKDTFVVYDSGVFEKRHTDKLVQEYVLKPEVAERISVVLFNTLQLMKQWVPDVTRLKKGEGRFRIIKEFFSPSANGVAGDDELYVADIISVKK